MSELLNRFSFVTARITGEVAIFMLLIWAVILTCAISSVRAQPWSQYIAGNEGKKDEPEKK